MMLGENESGLLWWWLVRLKKE